MGGGPDIAGEACMQHITVTTRHRFNENGKFGALLFVLCPVLQIACYAWYASEIVDAARNPYGADFSSLAAFAGVAFTIVWLASILMIFTGRTYDHTVVIGTVEPPAVGPKPADATQEPFIPPSGSSGPRFKPGLRRW